MTQSVKSTRVDHAYERLKSDILTAALPPGFQAPEPDIAVRLGMSRTPVREALIRLESEGLVDLIPRRGAKVLGLGQDDLVEIHEMLAALEAIAAREAAGRGLSGPAANDLRESLSAMSTARAGGDMSTWAHLDNTFHRQLVACHANTRLARVTSQLLDQLHRGRMVLLRMNKAPERPEADHETLLAAVLDGDGPLAEDIARRHRLDSLDVLTGLLRDCGLTVI
ncbi:MAG: GntR family transcriptional regulator [Roseibium sp.]|nr:GntR family transcriptional regulator [Roseibium sp.]